MTFWECHILFILKIWHWPICSSRCIKLSCQNFRHLLLYLTGDLCIVVWCIVGSGTDEKDDTVEQILSVVEKQRREIDYLEHVLEDLTSQRLANTCDLLLAASSFCFVSFLAARFLWGFPKEIVRLLVWDFYRPDAFLFLATCVGALSA